MGQNCEHLSTEWISILWMYMHEITFEHLMNEFSRSKSTLSGRSKIRQWQTWICRRASNEVLGSTGNKREKWRLIQKRWIFAFRTNRLQQSNGDQGVNFEVGFVILRYSESIVIDNYRSALGFTRERMHHEMWVNLSALQVCCSFECLFWTMRFCMLLYCICRPSVCELRDFLSQDLHNLLSIHLIWKLQIQEFDSSLITVVLYKAVNYLAYPVRKQAWRFLAVKNSYRRGAQG